MTHLASVKVSDEDFIDVRSHVAPFVVAKAWKRQNLLNDGLETCYWRGLRFAPARTHSAQCLFEIHFHLHVKRFAEIEG